MDYKAGMELTVDQLKALEVEIENSTELNKHLMLLPLIMRIENLG